MFISAACKAPASLPHCAKIQTHFDRRRCCIEAAAAPVWVRTYHEYILIETARKAIGIPSELSSWDISIPAFGNNPRILHSESVRNLKQTIDDLHHPEGKSPRLVEAELKVQAFYGYNIYYYESRYFAVPQEQNGFDIDRFRSQSTSQMSVGHTIQDIQEEILRKQ